MQTVALCKWHEVGPLVPLSIAALVLHDEGQERKQHCSHDKANHVALPLAGIVPLAL
jgi:hypothetical protein